jgi:hypothetical protein
MYIYSLSRIHNTSPVSAYFGLDNRECECLEYLLLFIIWFNESFLNKVHIIKAILLTLLFSVQDWREWAVLTTANTSFDHAKLTLGLNLFTNDVRCNWLHLYKQNFAP